MLVRSVKNDTRNPVWNETLTFSTTLPRIRDRRPEMVVQIWDRDEGVGESDDFVGNVVLRLNEDDGVEAKWQKVFYQEAGDVKCGEVMISVAVVQEDDGADFDSDEEGDADVSYVSSPAPSSAGKEEDWRQKIPMKRDSKVGTVEVIALGCRNLKPVSSLQGLNRPFVSCRIEVRAEKVLFTLPLGRF